MKFLVVLILCCKSISVLLKEMHIDLSPGVQNELFIHLTTSHVCKNLTEKIKKAKYYGLIQYLTQPDQAHREQVIEVVRYVDIDFDKKTVCVNDPFWASSNFIKKMLQVSLKLLCNNYRRMR